MDNQQRYWNLLETISRQMVPGFAVEVGPIRDLKGRLNDIVNNCQEVIDADRDDSDYEHMWSAKALDAFEEQFVPHLVLRLAEQLEHLDLYSTEALELIRRHTDYPKEGGHSFTFVQKGPYEGLQNEMREIILGYLSTNAKDDQERHKIEAFQRELSTK